MGRGTGSSSSEEAAGGDGLAHLRCKRVRTKGIRKDLAPDTYAYPCPPGRPGAVSQLFPTAYYK